MAPLDLFDEIEFESVGGVVAERFCDTIQGHSPFNGTMFVAASRELTHVPTMD